MAAGASKQATASPTYEANTIVAFGGIPVKAVKLTVNSGWGPLGQFGLSEIQFMQIPAKTAVGKLGHWPRKSLQYYVDAYYESGWIKTRDIEIDKMYTNDLIADINAFDEGKVRAAARAAN